MKDHIIYLKHMLDCVDKIKLFTTDFNRDKFVNNLLVQDAVIRNFEIIGEAAKHLDNNFRSRHPNIEWKRIAGMRDKLIHDYIGVDILAVWGVVEHVIPKFNNQLLEIIQAETSK